VSAEFIIYALLFFVGSVIWTGVATVTRLNRIIALLEEKQKPVEKPD
jgi:hypothetical protein